MDMGLGRHPADRPTFFQNYGLSTYQRGSNVLVNGLSEGVSQLFLSGRGDRSYFDMRGIYYYGFSEADAQSRFRSSIRLWITATCTASRSWAANSAIRPTSRA
jgi:hypothetical protein